MNINPFKQAKNDKGKRREPKLSQEASDLARKLDSLPPGIYVGIISKEENGLLKPAIFELGDMVHTSDLGERLFKDRLKYPELEQKMKDEAAALLKGVKTDG